MITIYVDLDSTLYDYKKSYLRYHFQKTGEIITQSAVDNNGYALHKACGLDEDSKYEYLRHENFFKDMLPYDGAINTIDSLYKSGKYEIIFVTHIVVPEAYMGKVESLQKFFNWFDFEQHLVTMKNKHLLVKGVIIDDNPFVIKNSNGHHITIAFNQPWNTDIDSDFRINGWDEELEEVLKHIEYAKLDGRWRD